MNVQLYSLSLWDVQASTNTVRNKPRENVLNYLKSSNYMTYSVVLMNCISSSCLQGCFLFFQDLTYGAYALYNVITCIVHTGV